MKKIIFFLIILFFAMRLDADGSIGQVIAVRGEAWIIPASGVREELVRKQQVFVGDKIITNENSYVKIFLIDDSVLTIGANSKFVVTKFVVSERSRISIFNLIEGKIKAVISKFLRKGAENRVLVNTPTAVAGVRGTEFIVETNGKVTEVGVLDGEVEVKDLSGLGSVILKPGFQTLVRAGGAPLPPSPLNLRQIRRIQQEFYLNKQTKKQEVKDATQQSFMISDKEFMRIKKTIRTMKPQIIRRVRVHKPPVNTPLSLGNNALVHIRVVFPK